MQATFEQLAMPAEAARARITKRKGGCQQRLVPRTFELIHYGASEYRPEKVMPIVDRHWVKPNGGLWTSPINSEYGWKQWCEAESFGDLTKHFKVRFSGKVLTIDGVADMEQLCWVEPSPGWQVPMWEYLSFAGVDAVHLTIKGERETRFSKPKSLYGWDCETVLVMNADCVSPWNAPHGRLQRESRLTIIRHGDQ